MPLRNAEERTVKDLLAEVRKRILRNFFILPNFTQCVLRVPVSFHPGAGWRLFAGPGYEWAEKKNHWMLRTGFGYEFHLSGQWTLAPEFIVDWIDGGSVTLITGVGIGYQF